MLEKTKKRLSKIGIWFVVAGIILLVGLTAAIFIFDLSNFKEQIVVEYLLQIFGLIVVIGIVLTIIGKSKL